MIRTPCSRGLDIATRHDVVAACYYFLLCTYCDSARMLLLLLLAFTLIPFYSLSSHSGFCSNAAKPIKMTLHNYDLPVNYIYICGGMSFHTKLLSGFSFFYFICCTSTCTRVLYYSGVVELEYCSMTLDKVVHLLRKTGILSTQNIWQDILKGKLQYHLYVCHFYNNDQ